MIKSTHDLRIYFTERGYLTADDLMSGLYIAGARGSGKSYLLGKIAEQLRDWMAVLLYDPVRANPNVLPNAVSAEITGADRAYAQFSRHDSDIYVPGFFQSDIWLAEFIRYAVLDSRGPKRPRMILIDEAHALSKDARHWYNEAVLMLRARGIGTVAASQRFVNIPTSAQEMTQFWVVMRITGARDKTWIRKNLLEHESKAEQDTTIKRITALKRGEFVMFGGNLR